MMSEDSEIISMGGKSLTCCDCNCHLTDLVELKSPNNESEVNQNPQVPASDSSMESVMKENAALKAALEDAWGNHARLLYKQKMMRKEFDLMEAELYNYRNKNVAHHQSKCDISTQTALDSNFTSDADSIEENDGKDRPLPDWITMKPESQSVAESVKDVAEMMVIELDMEKEKTLDGDSNVATGSSMENHPVDCFSSDSPFVYDSSSGMYYDHTSGYYYDANSTLYYDPRTGTYFYYNYTTNEYKFHSKVDSTTSENINECESHLSDSSLKSKTEDSSELEEGEIKEHKKKKSKKKLKKKQKHSHKHSSDLPVDQQWESCSTHLLSAEDNTNTSTEFNPEGCHLTAATVSYGISPPQSLSEKEEADYLACQELYAQSSKPIEPEQFYYKKSDPCDLWPACVRLIVTKSSYLKIGKLFLVTYTGASIGQRDKDLIQIMDSGKPGLFAKISFHEKNQNYAVISYSKQIGPFVNSKEVLQGESPVPLQHEDTLTVGGTTMAVHIHPGSETCDDCEPGLVQAKYDSQSKTCQPENLPSEKSKRAKHRQQLKEIKKKYGLKDSAYVSNVEALKNPNYSDKASIRRKTVGSSNPYIENTAKAASVNEEIPSENKGRKMLEKLGWNPGECLGKSNQNITEPITAQLRTDQHAGLGMDCQASITTSQKYKNWMNARIRFERIEKGKKGDKLDTKLSKSHKMWVQGKTLQPS